MEESVMQMEVDSRDDSAAAGTLWRDDYMFSPNQALTLAMCPEELLLGSKGRQRVEEAMQGVDRPVIEELDGFFQTPTRGQCYDMNLLMVAASEGSTTILKYWIQECGMNPNAARNSELWSPLIYAEAYRKGANRDFLRKCSDIGLPEAAALGMADVVPKMIEEYNELPHEKKWYSLSGEEIAFIFSGLSGDEEFVLSLAGGCQDLSVGHDKPTGNVVKHAIMSGNVGLVRKLLELGACLDSPYYSRSPAFWALISVPMLELLLEELKMCTLDVLSPNGCSLLESALLDRQNEAAKYLLAKRSPMEWSYLTQNNLLSQSMGKWNCLSPELLPMINSGNVQEVLRVSLRHSYLDIARTCLERGGSLAKLSKKGICTLLEEAVSSGSVRTVDFVLRNGSEELASFVHDNGYNALVAASRVGRAVFERLAAHFPNRLNETVWCGLSLLHIAASDKVGGVIDAILEDDFYEAHCRGKVLDANTECDNGRTALWCAVRAGVVANVEKFLQRKGYLALKELNDSKSVNTLFRMASRQTTFPGLLACFHSHGMTYTGSDGDDSEATSLAMEAAESGALLQVANPMSDLRKLQDMDMSAGLSVPTELLLSAVLRSAPEWAVNQGKLADLVEQFFLDGAVWKGDNREIRFRTTYELALTRCDFRTARAFQLHPLFNSSSCCRSPCTVAFLAFKGKGKGKDKMAHPSVTTRRNNFLSWLFSQGTEQPMPNSEGTPFAVLESLIYAGVSVRSAKVGAGAGAERHHLARRCSSSELRALLALATKLCQFENVKIIAEALGERGALDLSDCGYKGKKKNLVHVALGTQQLADEADANRLPLIQWLVASGVDLSEADNDGETALMKAAAAGNMKTFGWIAEELGEEAFKVRDNHDNNIVSFAIKGGRIDIIMRCVGVAGAYVCGTQGESALHSAVACGKLYVARYLVEVLGVDVNACDATNRTVMDYLDFSNDSLLEAYLEEKTGTKASSKPKTTVQTVQGWLEDVGAKSGSILRLNQSGLCALDYNGHTIVVELPKESSNIYVYCALDGLKYDIKEDSRVVLARSSGNGQGNKFCPAMDKNGHDAVLSAQVRVSESSSAGFTQILEDFSDAIVSLAEQLTAVAARRYLARALAPHSSGQNVDRVLDAVEGCIVKRPKKRPSLGAPDLKIVKESLQCQLDELNRIIRGGGLKVNEAGTCNFSYEHLTITLGPSCTPQTLLWTVPLWKVMSDGPVTDALRLRFLKLNYLQTDTKGGMIVESGPTGQEELAFVFEDRVDIAHIEFRNMLENLIDKALDLYKALRETNEKAKERSDLEQEIKSRKVTILDSLRLGDYSILERVLEDAPADTVSDRLEQLALLVLDTTMMDFWIQFLATMMRRAESSSRVPMEELRNRILKLVLARDMFNASMLDSLIDGESKFIQDLGYLHHIFSSGPLLRKGKASETAQRVLDMSIDKGVSLDYDEIHLEKWNNYASTVIYTGSGTDNVQEVIRCLEWLFTRTKPGQLDSETEVRTLLHQCAAAGEIPLLEFMMDRLPHLTLDEETLVWASRLEKLALVRWILERGDNIPRSKAIVSAAAAGSTDILDALGVGAASNTDGKGEEGSSGSLSDCAPSHEEKEQARAIRVALKDAAHNAVGRGNAEVLAHVLEDSRFFGAFLNNLLEEAAACSNPKMMIETIMASRLARRETYAMNIPWQAQATAKRKLVLPILQVAKRHCLPEEISALVHSYASPKFQESPLIRSAVGLSDKKVLDQLERDLDLGKGSIDSRRANNGQLVFDLPKVGSLEVDSGEGACRLTKAFEFSKEEFRTTPGDLLELSRALPGCFLTSNNAESGVTLRCVRRFSARDGIRYHEWRKMIVAFRRCSSTVSSVLSHARKFKLLASVSSLGVFVPEILQFAKAARSTRMIVIRGRTIAETWFASHGLVLITTPTDRQAADRSELLRANSLAAAPPDADGTFFFLDPQGVARVGIYVTSEEAAARDNKRAVLVARAQMLM